MTEIRTLVFVYNADSGLFNTVADIGHKIFSPETYACQLCALTHGYFSMRSEWKRFIEELGIPCEFMHRDEFVTRYGKTMQALPAVFVRVGNNEPEPCLGTESISACSDLYELMRLIRERCEDRPDYGRYAEPVARP